MRASFICLNAAGNPQFRRAALFGMDETGLCAPREWPSLQRARDDHPSIRLNYLTVSGCAPIWSTHIATEPCPTATEINLVPCRACRKRRSVMRSKHDRNGKLGDDW